MAAIAEAQTPGAQPSADAAPIAEGGETRFACSPDNGDAQSVARVADGETLVLADGSEVRLEGSLIPRAFDAGVAGADWPAESEARDALVRLVAGRAVLLGRATRRDRWGHHTAQVFVERDGRHVWVQAAMVAAGQARATTVADGSACTRELIAREAAARAEGLGIWTNPAYAVMQATAPRDLLRRRNTYQLVEGTVAAVASVRGHIYLNFGADWRSDFTAGIATAHKGHTDKGWLDELRALGGRRVRVRGWVERQNGPYIAVTDPAQIELLDGMSAGAAAAPGVAQTETETVTDEAAAAVVNPDDARR